jgi:CPA2 family monovalent cation:H+ antiporter-2
VASAHSTDLFVAAVLFVIVGAGVLSSIAGLSMALGAFTAGLLLAETEFDKAIKGTVEPFKGLLLGLFFFTVGMGVDLHVVLEHPMLLLACVAALIVLKASVLTALARVFRLPWSSGIEMGLLLGPGGEFAFVGISMATALGLLDHSQSGFLLVLTTVTMALIPALSAAATRMRAALGARHIDPELTVRPSPAPRRAIVVGYGRVGSVVCEMLDRQSLAFLAVDRDPHTVTEARRAHAEVYYGNAADPEFLQACGIETAPGLVLTFTVAEVLDEIIRVVRYLRPDIPIVARARDADHAHRLYLAGVTEAVPETIEASLQLSEAALVSLGVAMGPAIASIHERRDEFKKELRAAASGTANGVHAPKLSGSAP